MLAVIKRERGVYNLIREPSHQKTSNCIRQGKENGIDSSNWPNSQGIRRFIGNIWQSSILWLPVNRLPYSMAPGLQEISLHWKSFLLPPQPMNQFERNEMAQKRKRTTRTRRKRGTSIVGNIMMEVLAIAAFLALLSASKDYSTVDSANQAAQPVRTAEYSSMLHGYLSDQFQRHGISGERR